MKNEKYQAPLNIYISSSYDDAELAQKFLSDYVKGFGITVDKQRNGDDLYVTIDGLDEDIDALVSVYIAQYDEFKKDCKAEPSGWVSPVNFEKSKEDESMKSESNIEDLRDQTISWGTMRSEDLIPKFLGVLKTYAKDKYDEYVNENPEVLDIDGLDDETLGWIVDELFDKLDEIAPEGTYFGAHPDDGADYGFWSVEESKQREAKKSEGTDDKDDKSCKGKGCNGSDEKCGGYKKKENRGKLQEGSSASNNWVAYYFCKDPQGLEWAVLPHTVSMIGNVNCVNARGGMESIGKEYVLSKCTPVEDVESSEIWKAVCDGEDRKVVAIDRNDAERVLRAENGLEELKSVVAGKDESKKNERGSTQIETYDGFEELIGYADAEYVLEDVVDVLSKYYTYEGEGDDIVFDEDQAKDDPEFTIKIEGGDERANYYYENKFYVHLPSKEAAEELAKVLGGELNESKKNENLTDTEEQEWYRFWFDDVKKHIVSGKSGSVEHNCKMLPHSDVRQMWGVAAMAKELCDNFRRYLSYRGYTNSKGSPFAEISWRAEDAGDLLTAMNKADGTSNESKKSKSTENTTESERISFIKDLANKLGIDNLEENRASAYMSGWRYFNNDDEGGDGIVLNLKAYPWARNDQYATIDVWLETESGVIDDCWLSFDFGGNYKNSINADKILTTLKTQLHTLWSRHEGVAKKSESLTLKQAELKKMAKYGEAEDITGLSDAEAKELKKSGVELVGISRGTYGMNGALMRGTADGKLYVITSRNSNLFYFV